MNYCRKEIKSTNLLVIIMSLITFGLSYCKPTGSSLQDEKKSVKTIAKISKVDFTLDLDTTGNLALHSKESKNVSISDLRVIYNGAGVKDKKQIADGKSFSTPKLPFAIVKFNLEKGDDLLSCFNNNDKIFVNKQSSANCASFKESCEQNDSGVYANQTCNCKDKEKSKDDQITKAEFLAFSSLSSIEMCHGATKRSSDDGNTPYNLDNFNMYCRTGKTDKTDKTDVRVRGIPEKNNNENFCRCLHTPGAIDGQEDSIDFVKYTGNEKIDKEKIDAVCVNAEKESSSSLTESNSNDEPIEKAPETPESKIEEDSDETKNDEKKEPSSTQD